MFPVIANSGQLLLIVSTVFSNIQFYLIKPGVAFNRTGKFYLPAGSYTLYAYDYSGNRISKAVSILENDIVYIDTIYTTQPSCKLNTKGSIEVVARGGVPPYKYYWSSTFPIDSSKVSNVEPGNYPVRVYDSKGCYSEEEHVVLKKETQIRLDSTISFPPHCYKKDNGSIQIHSSMGIRDSLGNYSYTPSNGQAVYGIYLPNAGWQTNSNGLFTGLAEGLYSITIRDTGNCYSDSYYWNVSAPIKGLPTLSADNLGFDLDGGVINLNCPNFFRVNTNFFSWERYNILVLDSFNQITLQDSFLNSYQFPTSPNGKYKVVVEDSLGLFYGYN